jgi:hypothetical protein
LLFQFAIVKVAALDLFASFIVLFFINWFKGSGSVIVLPIAMAIVVSFCSSKKYILHF